MCKNTISIVLVLLLLPCCVMEPPATFYSFIIVNDTEDTLFIDSRTVQYNEYNFDTIYPSQSFKKEIFRLGCFKNFNDSLIQSFFCELKISAKHRNLSKDPYNRKNWEDSSALKGGSCKHGTAYYKFVVNKLVLK